MLRSLAVGSLLLATAAADPCDCLNWKQLYDAKRVSCGEGQELQNETGMGYQMAYWAPTVVHGADRVCNVYTAMDNNMCYNWALPTLYGSDKKKHNRGQWCYVDSKCTKLNGGRKVADSATIVEWVPKQILGLLGMEWGIKVYHWINDNLHSKQPLPRDVSVKICGGKDSLSRDMEPGKLLELGVASGVPVDVLTKMAYYVVRDNDRHGLAHPIWQDVRGPIGKGGDLTKLPDDIQKAIEKKVPIVIDTDAYAHHDKSQRIIVGSKVYKLNAECPDKSCHGPKAHELTYIAKKGHDVGEL